jgi:diadenosine tetraphosphatase ApaH/serine/threonine PP2A family protein phosphatase
VETIRQVADRCLAGNHDHAVIGRTDAASFNRQAQAAVCWTAEVLRDDHRSYLSDLSLTSDDDSMLLVHASPMEPSQWHYVMTTEAADRAFGSFDEPLCLIGHSHRPLVAARQGDGRCRLSVDSEVRLQSDVRYIINVGSVGQPRDGDPRAGFVVLDTGENLAKLERVSYDVDAAGKAILDAGLPVTLAERLQNGR